jgi:hypothetical protein
MVTGMGLFSKLQQKSNHIRIFRPGFFHRLMWKAATVAIFPQPTVKIEKEQHLLKDRTTEDQPKYADKKANLDYRIAGLPSSGLWTIRRNTLLRLYDQEQNAHDPL